MTGSVLLYTCANGAYEDFLPALAYTAFRLDPRYLAEFGVEDAEAFEQAHAASLAHIRAAFPDRPLGLRSVAWRAADGGRIKPNTIRFITPPLTAAPFVYITDADFLFLNRGMIDQHLRFMKRTGLPYSNSVRPGTAQMSGLHFTRWDALYPLPSLGGLDLAANDEVNLREICVRKGLPIQDSRWFRPIPGIHMSPNREVEKQVEADKVRPGWSVPTFTAPYLTLTAEPDFQAFRRTLSPRLQENLDRIDQAIAAAPAA